ncbi:UNKNOWN [Stylonychia lemnae]|uniref:Cyclic nucleotide-binding domain-containing protein n=1 Tax=Stylonychia lemnae TaxID=5949 RepID=A0A078AUC4_STYLE|nr:UNKNOWN [Stylonychia lemnae]|eukprot:CDW84448.1 UNKNOWN [Stylonychia lemnae]
MIIQILKKNAESRTQVDLMTVMPLVKEQKFFQMHRIQGKDLNDVCELLTYEYFPQGSIISNYNGQVDIMMDYKKRAISNDNDFKEFITDLELSFQKAQDIRQSFSNFDPSKVNQTCQVAVHQYLKGQLFGTQSIIKDQRQYKRPYQAVAAVDTHIGVFSKKSFERILDRIHKKFVQKEINFLKNVEQFAGLIKDGELEVKKHVYEPKSSNKEYELLHNPTLTKKFNNNFMKVQGFKISNEISVAIYQILIFMQLFVLGSGKMIGDDESIRGSKYLTTVICNTQDSKVFQMKKDSDEAWQSILSESAEISKKMQNIYLQKIQRSKEVTNALKDNSEIKLMCDSLMKEMLWAQVPQTIKYYEIKKNQQQQIQAQNQQNQDHGYGNQVETSQDRNNSTQFTSNSNYNNSVKLGTGTSILSKLKRHIDQFDGQQSHRRNFSQMQQQYNSLNENFRYSENEYFNQNQAKNNKNEAINKSLDLKQNPLKNARFLEKKTLEMSINFNQKFMNRITSKHTQASLTKVNQTFKFENEKIESMTQKDKINQTMKDLQIENFNPDSILQSRPQSHAEKYKNHPQVIMQPKLKSILSHKEEPYSNINPLQPQVTQRNTTMNNTTTDRSRQQASTFYRTQSAISNYNSKRRKDQFKTHRQLQKVVENFDVVQNYALKELAIPNNFNNVVSRSINKPGQSYFYQNQAYTMSSKNKDKKKYHEMEFINQQLKSFHSSTGNQSSSPYMIQRLNLGMKTGDASNIQSAKLTVKDKFQKVTQQLSFDRGETIRQSNKFLKEQPSNVSNSIPIRKDKRKQAEEEYEYFKSRIQKPY